MYILFLGIPGCAKSALCKHIKSALEGLEDDRPVHSLMGDDIKGVLALSKILYYKLSPFLS